MTRKLLLFLVLSLGTTSCGDRTAALWLTPDQQGRRLFSAGRYAEAAERFADAEWRGAALFRDGQFEAAAASFARVDTAACAFNRGNALVMHGKYDDAIASYDRALQLRPGWKKATENRELARRRRERMKRPEGDPGAEAGNLPPDEIVFDDAAKDAAGREEVELGQGERLSDEELRAIWLRRVQTRPRDFLRAKFAYQNARASAEGDGE